MKSKGMEGEINIYVDIDIRKGAIKYANENKGVILGATSEMMSFFFRHSRKMLKGFARPVSGRPKEPTVSKQQRALIRTFPQPQDGEMK